MPCPWGRHGARRQGPQGGLWVFALAPRAMIMARAGMGGSRRGRNGQWVSNKSSALDLGLSRCSLSVQGEPLWRQLDRYRTQEVRESPVYQCNWTDKLEELEMVQKKHVSNLWGEWGAGVWEAVGRTVRSHPALPLAVFLNAPICTLGSRDQAHWVLRRIKGLNAHGTLRATPGL